jgi:chorismate mutase
MKEIERLREKVDKIDLKLVKTLYKRNKITSKIKQLKQKNNIKIEDKSREKIILNRLKSIKLVRSKSLEKIYKEIFNLTKK